MERSRQVINSTLLINKGENQKILFNRIVNFLLLESHREGWDRKTSGLLF